MHAVGLSSNGGVTGQYRPNRKLTEAQVAELRKLRKERGWTYKALGEHFGVSDQLAWQIVRRKTWNRDPVRTVQHADERDIERIAELAATLRDHKEIARVMGVSRHSVLLLMRAHGLLRKTIAQLNSEKTECLRGHPLDGDNLVVNTRGQRSCRECRRAADQRSNEKRRLARSK